jgi:hypothetical protein
MGFCFLLTSGCKLCRKKIVLEACNSSIAYEGTQLYICYIAYYYINLSFLWRSVLIYYNSSGNTKTEFFCCYMQDTHACEQYITLFVWSVARVSLNLSKQQITGTQDWCRRLFLSRSTTFEGSVLVCVVSEYFRFLYFFFLWLFRRRFIEILVICLWEIRTFLSSTDA